MKRASAGAIRCDLSLIATQTAIGGKWPHCNPLNGARIMTTRKISLSLVVAIAALSPAAASASHGTDDNPAAGDDHGGLRQDHGGGAGAKRVSGNCSDNATSKLKVKPDNGRLETEFEVDQNRSGVTWKVTIRRNGSVAVKTNATTHAPSGSFSVERRLANGRGKDRISARATSPSGQVCTASLSI